MCTPIAVPIKLIPEHRVILEDIVNRRNSPQGLVKRARIILLAGEGHSNAQVAEILDININTVRLWRSRWYENVSRLFFCTYAVALNCLTLNYHCHPLFFSKLTLYISKLLIEKEKMMCLELNTLRKGQKDLKNIIAEVLGDAVRSGAPVKFTAEQFTAIIALACESPEKYGRPVTHWTPRELAAESVKQGIMESVSCSTLVRLLNEAAIKPHLSRYWEFNERDKDPQSFDQKIHEVNELYKNAAKLQQKGCAVVCFDEKTGIQSLERAASTLPVSVGQVEKREFNYKRHGTLVLTANFEVSTGQIISPTIETTRTESQLAAHIERTINMRPDGEWIFICDQLNTHKSESLVKLTATLCGIKEDLGIKEKSGILKSMETRQEFLENDSHRIRFVYLPKHTSWMNQVEMWFSILSRRVLKRGNFTSLENLKKRLLDFIDYFNKVLAKPFRWTYSGKPLKA